MKEIEVHVSTGYVGCNKSDTFEVEDDATDEEINEIALDILFELISFEWFEKDDT